jgi:processive rubber oxygenase RoxA-like protein
MTKSRFLRISSLAAAASLLSMTAGCDWFNKKPGKPAVLQGWNTEQQNWWYSEPQGSRLMPLSWWETLEQPTSDKPFLDDAFMDSFRFISRAGAMPIGFAVDRQDDTKLTYTKLRWYENQPATEPWVGLNCSACHTGALNYGGQTTRVDGGQSLVDFQSFTDAVDASLKATHDDDAKFGRFATNVLEGKDNPANRTLLRQELKKLVEWEARLQNMNEPEPVPRYGYGRLDAVGHIYNKVALLVQAADPIPNPSDAPVNYPYLWGIYRHNRLQYDGIVASTRIPPKADKYLDFGALGRNTGEVIGVFGDVDVRPMPEGGGFPSSLLAANLDNLETQLRSLDAPTWPDHFPKIDDTLADAGEPLYEKKCQGCHVKVPSGTAVFDIHMQPQIQGNANNTDPWMACNALSYRGRSGNLTGRPSSYFTGEALGPVEQMSTLLESTVKATMLAKWGDILKQVGRIVLGIQELPAPPGEADVDEDPRQARLNACYAANSPLFAYKGRPLNGVWATAPFLHNGSVPTLRDLLMPPAERPASFNVGTRDYDPVNLGYVTVAEAPGNSFRYDTSVTGNSNQGHDYGVSQLTPEERAAILEYMKRL